MTRVAPDLHAILAAAESQKSSPETLMLVLRAKPDGLQHTAGIFLEIIVTMESHQGLLQLYRAQYHRVLPLNCGYHQAA